MKKVTYLNAFLDERIIWGDRYAKPYDIEGLTRVEVRKLPQGSITDLQRNGAWYQTISRKNTQTCYTIKQRYIQRTCQRTVYDTITPPNKSEQIKAEYPAGAVGLATGGSYGFSVMGAFMGIPAGSSIRELIVNIQVLAFNGASNYQIVRYEDNGVVGSGSADIHYPWTNSHSISNLSGTMPYSLRVYCTYTPFQLHIYGISYIASYTSYQQPRVENYDCSYWENYEEPYDCSTYYTNANFKTGNFTPASNRGELVIENNSQTINRGTLYTSVGGTLGNIISNANVKFAAVNNRANQSIYAELFCTNPGVNWFYDTWFKDIFNNQSLIDVHHEISAKLTHNLTNTQVTTAINNSTTNRDIYRRRISINNVPYTNKKIARRIRPDYKNIRWYIEESKILLNHSVDNQGRFTIEFPDSSLKNGDITLNMTILPKNYVYNNYNIDTALSNLVINNIEYEL